MKKLVYSKDALRLPPTLFTKGYKSVFAGSGCVMAVTSQGKLIQNTAEGVAPVNIRCYENVDIAEVAISGACPGMTIALDKSGRCCIDWSAADRYCTNSGYVRKAVSAVEQWHGIVAVAVSDAYFALDADGRVHFAALNDYNAREYAPTAEWENIVRIVAGPQNLIFGVTAEGRVLCTGSNCLGGPHGDMRTILDEIQYVADIGVMGAECGEIVVVFKDGRVKGLFSDIDDRMSVPRGKVLSSSQNCVVAKDAHGVLRFYCREPWIEEQFACLKNKSFESFALGDINSIYPFIAAISE